MKRHRTFSMAMKKEKTQTYLPQNTSPEPFGNGVAFEVSSSEIVRVTHDLHKTGYLSLKLITATDEREEQGCFKVWYVFGIPTEHRFVIPYIRLSDTLEFPSVTRSIHQAWNHERKIRAFFGLIPIGHPDPRPLILHENWPPDLFPLRKDVNWDSRPKPAHGTYHFQRLRGEGIYEIPVGPVHAGIIEPGHFRFSVAGEAIMLLEPRLGFTHKGSEKLFERLPISEKLRLSEKLSGDSSVSHSMAFCQALEQLSAITVPERALYLRLIFAELERIANHLGDIGAIMLDTGFNFGGSHGARLRETVMRINERLTGSRFLRGVITPGGVTKDISAEEARRLSAELALVAQDFFEMVEAAENIASLMNRLKSTGIVSSDIAIDHGAVGVAAKAVNIAIDARVDFPYAAYNTLCFDRIETEVDGDVYARFRVRVKEVNASITIIQKALGSLPQAPILSPDNDTPFRKNAVAVGIVEGWRGEIVYFVTTDARGTISRVAPRDPSFVNWSLLEHAAQGNIVPDFPLINKSFNLSYSGNDL
jgi:Ni,Fe-hydrogenase III large subunit/Ni,Fe-hydrogenase III component G